MKRTIFLRLIVILGSLIAFASPALAQSGGDYELTWSTVDGGGGALGGDAGYVLDSTAGQPDVGALTAGAYTLVGGFWSGAGVVEIEGWFYIYLPLIVRNQ